MKSAAGESIRIPLLVFKKIDFIYNSITRYSYKMQKDINIVWTVLEKHLRQRYLEHTPIPRGLMPKLPIAKSTLMTGSFPISSHSLTVEEGGMVQFTKLFVNVD